MANLVLDRLKTTKENFIGIFTYGSQNYGLDYIGSDIDAILIVHEYKKPKQEIILSTGIVKVYTLKYFLYRLKQGDLECYEILYTKYKELNPLYIDCFTKFVKEFSSCISYERIKNSLCTKLAEHLNTVLWLPTSKENARYHKKRLYWAIRVCNQLQRVIAGESFESSLLYKPTLDYDILKIKTLTNYLSLKDFGEIYNYLVTFVKSLSKYSAKVTEQEETCLSTFYKELSTNNKC